MFKGIRNWFSKHHAGVNVVTEAVTTDLALTLFRYLLAAGAASAATVALTTTTATFHPSYPMSPKGLAFVERHEGVVYHPYQDPAGIAACTGGAGHVIDWHYCTSAQLRQVISAAQVKMWLISDTTSARNCISDKTTYHLTQYEYEALVDLVFNAGCGSLNYRGITDLVNSGRLSLVPDALAHTAVTAGGRYLSGLYQRRLDEGALFARGYYGYGIGYYASPAKPKPVQVAEAKLRAKTGYYAWLGWYLHRDAWRAYAVHATVVRPNVPAKVPRAWWVKEHKFVQAESKR